MEAEDCDDSCFRWDGFVGSAIVKELLLRGEAVAVMGRDAEKVRTKFGDGVDARAGDVREPETLADAMLGIDSVINAVQFPGSPVERRSKGYTFEEVDLKGTRHQVDAAKQAGVRRFVYVSGVGAAKEAPQHWFASNGRRRTTSRSRGSGRRRPTWVFGPETSPTGSWLGKMLPFIPMFGDGKQTCSRCSSTTSGAWYDAALRRRRRTRLSWAGRG
jgi:NADH dehydrogenase